jgi:hypothetical protein
VVYQEIKALYKKHNDRQTRPTLHQLLESLQPAVRTFSTVFVVVDALDECPDQTRAELLIALRSLTGLNLLVTSRNLPAIAQAFHGAGHLEVRASDHDVEKYIEGRIPRAGFLNIHLGKDATLKEEILKAITGNIDGMLVSLLLLLHSINVLLRFLLARFHVDLLATKISVLEVRKALQNLPKDTDEMYNETMKRVEGQNESSRKLAEHVFIWVIHAYRRLSLTELQHALAVSSDPEMTKMDPSALVDETILISVCAGLVVVDKESDVVRLVRKLVIS